MAVRAQRSFFGMHLQCPAAFFRVAACMASENGLVPPSLMTTIAAFIAFMYTPFVLAVFVAHDEMQLANTNRHNEIVPAACARQTPRPPHECGIIRIPTFARAPLSIVPHRPPKLAGGPNNARAYRSADLPISERYVTRRSCREKPSQRLPPSWHRWVRRPRE